MRKILLFGVAILFTQSLLSQECNCSDNYAWLKKTFEENDAGFHLVSQQNRDAEYKQHNSIFESRTKEIDNKQECLEALKDWLTFFRKGHLYLNMSNNSNQQVTSSDPAEIKKQFEDWETFPYVEEEFNTYISTIDDSNIEGIWTSSSYVLGIKKVENEYIGFVIEADGVYWSKTQVKFKIQEEGEDLSATFYMRDHSAQEIDKVELLGKNYLKMGAISLKRSNPTFPEDEKVERHLRYTSARASFFEQLTDNTAVLRVPTFGLHEKPRIDSIITANWEKVMGTENLIIDIRNNDGGFNKTYNEILKLLYTNPIRIMGTELLSTELNNQRMMFFLNSPNYANSWSEEEKENIRKSYKKLNKNLGEFVNLGESSVSVKTLDSVYQNPKNVGIIIHERNLSSAEEFLLAAKQSTKVKLFGRPTAGVQDISNMYFNESPCGGLQLRYSLSRSLRMPDMAIDNVGIQPDYFIDNSISEYDWIDFVEKTLNGKAY